MDTLAWLDPATGKATTEREVLEPTKATAILLATTAITTSLISVLIDGFPVWGAMVAGAILGIIVLSAVSGRAVKRRSGAVRVHRYKCVVCDHEWTWREGTPRPRYRYREQIMEEYERLFGDKAGGAEDKA